MDACTKVVLIKSKSLFEIKHTTLVILCFLVAHTKEKESVGFRFLIFYISFHLHLYCLLKETYCLFVFVVFKVDFSQEKQTFRVFTILFDSLEEEFLALVKLLVLLEKHICELNHYFYVVWHFLLRFLQQSNSPGLIFTRTNE